jgi:hypothetical protein
MAASTVHITYERKRLRKQLRRLPDACREMLDAFVSGWTQHTVSEAEHNRPHGSRPASTQTGSPPVFGPLDPRVISNSIPAFFIGQNRDRLWVAREATGRIGGLFIFRSSALAFAREQGGAAGCATIFPSELIELDLENEGNPLTGPLAQLLRFGSFCRIIGGACVALARPRNSRA